MDSRPLSLHSRRTRNEWRLLNDLATVNSGVVTSLGWTSIPPLDIFSFQLVNTPALVDCGPMRGLTTEHTAEIRFPRFFPAVPMELYLKIPVFHPNIDPLTGFVCLWADHSRSYTVCDALIRLQKILTFHLVNIDAPHVMQPAAHDYYRSARPAPLEHREIIMNPEWRAHNNIGQPTRRRQRLSDVCSS